MHDDETVIQEFYRAFAARDADAMAAAYADDARFHDPVFGELDAREVRAMWRMLVARGEDLVVELREVRSEAGCVRARWEATYTFSATGRRVHNVVHARFRLRDARIVEHEDRFSLWRWTRMALGARGVLLGWSPLVRGKVRSGAARGLAGFMGRDARE